MKFIEVETKNRTADFINRLLTVWESSVRATHLFLSDSEIKKIKEYVPQALIGIAHLMIAEDDRGCPVAFMGIEDGTLEMLFISPEERGKGLGKRLLQYGIKTYAVERVAVNEQNPQAKGFYEHLGFQVAGRKILCKRFSTKSRMALESRADSGLNPLITESHGGQNGMRAGTA